MTDKLSCSVSTLLLISFVLHDDQNLLLFLPNTIEEKPNFTLEN